MCETWFSTRMQPPLAGMFSPPTHSCFVVATNPALTMGSAITHAQLRFSCILRTTTCAGYSVGDLTGSG